MANTGRDEFFRVEGLRELQRELKTSPDRLDKDLRKGMRAIAKEIADTARQRAGSRSYPRPGHAVVRSIQASSTGVNSRVSIGGANVPWALGHEFGSLVHRQFPAWRGNKSDAGYFLWPTIREAREETIPAMVTSLLNEILAKAYPEPD